MAKTKKAPPAPQKTLGNLTMSDRVFKLISQVGWAFMIYMFTTVNRLDKDYQSSSQEIQYFQRNFIEYGDRVGTALSKMESFMDEPRFTEKSYNEKAEVLKKDILYNKGLSENQEKQLREIETRLVIIESKMKR